MKYILIFAKTAYSLTPFDIWLEGTGITPMILMPAEFADGYRHLDHLHAFDNYDRNQLVEKTAFELGRQFSPIGIFAGAEADAVRAAMVRERLQIQGQKTTSALAYRNSFIMKNYLKPFGIETPKYRLLTSALDAIDFIEKNGYPVAVKPTNAAGTQILREPRDLVKYLTQPVQGEMEIESFVDGERYHVDGLILDGQTAFIHPFKYENESQGNKFLGSHTLAPENPLTPRLTEAARKVVGALPATRNMAFHSEFWVTRHNRIVFCEIRSCTGGTLVRSLVEYSFGFNIDKTWLLAECGIFTEKDLRLRRFGGWMISPPQNGKLGFGEVPHNPLPDCVRDSQDCGTTRAGYIIKGNSEQEVRYNMDRTANWFAANSNCNLSEDATL